MCQFVFDDFYLGKIMQGDVFEVLVWDVEDLFAGDYTECVMSVRVNLP